MGNKYRITAPDGQTYEVTAPDGATQEEILAYAQKNFAQQSAAAPKPAAPEKGFGQKLDEAISDVPRQLGLTARYGVEGLGDIANFIASPARGALNALGGNFKPINAAGYADKMGLPSPQNQTERIVGNATRVLAGSAVPLAGATSLAKNSTGLTQAVATQMAANPTAQLASAAASGGAGQYAKETGGGGGAQFLSSLAAGVLTPMAMKSGSGILNNLIETAPATTQNIDLKIANALKNSDVNFSALPDSIRASIKNDVEAALKTGGDLSPDALRRLADYRLVNATPTRAGLTLDPAIVTQQKNLAKMGVNSKDAAAQQLAQVENQNNAKLIENLNSLGASRGLENEAAGTSLATGLNELAKAKKGEISSLYQAARDSSGRSAPLEPWTFTKNLDEKLSYANGNIFLPKEVRMMINQFANGKTPLNVDTAEQFKTIIGNEIVKANAAGSGNAVNALRLVRETLDETPLLTQAQRAGGNQLAAQGQSMPQVGQEAIDAFTKARSANRQFMKQVEETPALAAAMEDASVKGFFDKYVIRGDSKQLGATLKAIGDNPQAVQQLRDNVLAHLKEKAVSGSADEVGKFSQSRYNAALKMLGTNKLNMLFSPEEVAQLKAVGRVASYEQFQPTGAAVNNSNTAAGIAGLLDRVGNSPLLSKIPLGKMLAEPMQNISIGINSGKALNVPSVLSLPKVNPANNGVNPYSLPIGLLWNYQQQ